MRRPLFVAGLFLFAIAVALGARETFVRWGAPRIEPDRLGQKTLPLKAAQADLARNGTSSAQPGIPPAADATPEAIAEAERASSRAPGDATAQLRLGGLLYRARRFPEAIAVYEKALAIEPNSPLAYLGIGLCRGKNDESEPAEAAFRRAIEIDPKMAAAHNGLGVVLLRQGNRDAARTEFERALELDPALAVARTNLDAATQPPPEEVEQ